MYAEFARFENGEEAAWEEDEQLCERDTMEGNGDIATMTSLERPKRRHNEARVEKQEATVEEKEATVDEDGAEVPTIEVPTNINSKKFETTKFQTRNSPLSLEGLCKGYKFSIE